MSNIFLYQKKDLELHDKADPKNEPYEITIQYFRLVLSNFFR